MKGRYYVLEGLDGVGKSALAKGLREHHPDWLYVAEPGGTPIADTLRKIVKKGLNGEPISCVSETLMFMAARMQLIDNIIVPALHAGKTVLSDRNWITSLMYQGHGFDKPELIKALHKSITEFMPKPDLYLYVHLSLEDRIKRIAMRGKETDRLESRDSDYYVKVYNGYETWAESTSNVIILDGAKSKEQCLVRALTCLR